MRRLQQAINEAFEQHRSFGGDATESVPRAADMLCAFNALMLLRQIRPFTGFVGLGNIVSNDRPILLNAPSIQAEDEYDLARAKPETKFQIRRAALKMLAKQLPTNAQAGQRMTARVRGAVLNAQLGSVHVTPLAEITTEEKVNEFVERLVAMVEGEQLST